MSLWGSSASCVSSPHEAWLLLTGVLACTRLLMGVMNKPFGSREFGHELLSIASNWLSTCGPESLQRLLCIFALQLECA